MHTVTVSRKCYVTIPAELREKYNLRPGTKVYIMDDGRALTIVPALENPIEQTAGMVRTTKSLTEMIEAEHRTEVGSDRQH
jgi:AbrB family looped-hinge helix DNA binding protein